MFYRITLSLAFDEIDPTDDILDKAMDAFPDAKTINPGTENAEQSYIILERCFHDEDPTIPCEVMEQHRTD